MDKETVEHLAQLGLPTYRPALPATDITITIHGSGAAFEDDFAGEIARILTRLAGKVAETTLRNGDEITLTDGNGNSVGSLFAKTYH